MTTAVYVRAVSRAALATLQAVRVAQRRHRANAATLSEQRDVRLIALLAECWDLRVQPAALLEWVQAAASPTVMPIWADPHAILGRTDLGRLNVATGPGDMTALAGSTVSLLRMIRAAQHRAPAELARVCGITSDSLSYVESGEQDPDFALVLGICWHLRVLPSLLLRMAESRTFASGTRRPMWIDLRRLSSTTDIAHDRYDDPAAAQRALIGTETGVVRWRIRPMPPDVPAY